MDINQGAGDGQEGGMRKDEETSTWAKDGHQVVVGPVKTEVRNGKNRHYREIWLDGKVIGKSEGKNLVNARYRAAFDVDRALKVRAA
jgi:hypothetical protein